METPPTLPHEVWERTPPEAQASIRALEARVETLAFMVHTLQEQVRTLQEQRTKPPRMPHAHLRAMRRRTHSHVACGVIDVAVDTRVPLAIRAP